MTDITNTLTERKSRYGAFKDNAVTMQALKAVMRDTPNWETLPDYYKESLEMIAHKIGRILHGDITYVDNVHDIVGYAQLIENELQRNVVE